MKTIEEQLWDYLDGNCTENEKLEIETKINIDSNYAAVYAELCALQKILDEVELDEPSMSFTRNVMEKVNAEMSPVMMKTKINTQIIYAIVAFFAFSIGSLLVYAFSKSTFTVSNLGLDVNFTLPRFQKINNPIFMYSFLFFDIILGLLCLDSYLRRKMKD